VLARVAIHAFVFLAFLMEGGAKKVVDDLRTKAPEIQIRGAMWNANS
jgi:hypothetical protein